MMFEKDGFEVCVALKEDECISYIFIVLLIVCVGVEDCIVGLWCGVDVYFVKLFYEEELLIMFNNLFML